MIEPPPVLRIARMACLQPRKLPSTFTAKCSRQMSSGMSSNAMPGRNAPAALTSTSSEPRRATTASIAAIHAFSSVTSSGRKAARSPRRSAAPSRSGPRPVRKTCAPAAWKASARPSPMPLSAPVIRTFLSVSAIFFSSALPAYPAGMIGRSRIGRLPGLVCSVVVPPKTSAGRSTGSSWRNGPQPLSSFLKFDKCPPLLPCS